MQLTLEDADATIKGFGWVAIYTQSDFAGQSSWSIPTNDTVPAVVDVNTVSQEFKTQETAPVDDGNTDEDDGNNSEEEDEDEESDPETDDEPLCDKDGG